MKVLTIVALIVCVFELISSFAFTWQPSSLVEALLDKCVSGKSNKHTFLTVHLYFKVLTQEDHQQEQFDDISYPNAVECSELFEYEMNSMATHDQDQLETMSNCTVGDDYNEEVQMYSDYIIIVYFTSSIV